MRGQVQRRERESREQRAENELLPNLVLLVDALVQLRGQCQLHHYSVL